MSARRGFFKAMYHALRNPELDRFTKDRLQKLSWWFDDYLDLPPKFTRSKSKGSKYLEETRGLSWYKNSPDNIALQKSFEAVLILQQNGYLIEVIYAERVGYLIYEDEYQVVAEPFADTPI